MIVARLALLLPLVFGSLAVSESAVAAEKPTDFEPNSYQRLILDDQPIGYWSFDGITNNTVPNRAGSPVGPARIVKSVKTGQPGPTGESDRFPSDNPAITIRETGARLVVSDDSGELGFGKGDAITIEAWVNPDALEEKQMVYVVSKGRTFGKGFDQNNQNYSLRLRPIDGKLRVCFLFRGTEAGGEPTWYRWNSNASIESTRSRSAGDWHHVAVTYRFGERKDPVAFIDGKPSAGFWDMGQRNVAVPVTDRDALWIGSSMGGSFHSTYRGSLDEVAIYRGALSPERIALRVKRRPPAPPLPEPAVPTRSIAVEFFENVPETTRWSFPLGAATERRSLPVFAVPNLPHRYSDKGIRVDRSNPLVVRLSSRIALPSDTYQFLLRARNGARLFIDGKEVLTSKFHTISASAHGKIRHVAKLDEPDLRPLQTGDNEQTVELTLDGKSHLFELELYLGGKNKRPETGETLVAYRSTTESDSGIDQPTGPDAVTPPQNEGTERIAVPFTLLAPTEAWRFPLTHDGWDLFWETNRVMLREENARERQRASRGERRFWESRHRWVADRVRSESDLELPPATAATGEHPLDRFILARLEELNADANEKTAPTPIIDDEAFLRRVTLDIRGTVPTREQVEQFRADTSEDRRAAAIDRLLADDEGWADHWVPYWQDLLAENPNIINPTLNNTGPFRGWIYRSFLDNKPIDRFATELMEMRGSRFYGGPGGFAIASQNDAPMAAKAHVISQAFLGVDLKCARCHDAPFGDLKQRDLFELSAMLHRGPRSVPKSSTVPLGEGGSTSLLIEVTLKPGQPVAPKWPFEELSDSKLSSELVRNPKDTREVLAALVTGPDNERFARVIVNRLWKRYLGWGLVEPIDDWSRGEPSHPELLDWLARELMVSGYDLKHVARLIFTSDLYRRQAVPAPISTLEPFAFAGPVRRRMTAEQVIDSMFLAAGKRFRAGELNIDADGSRKYTQSLNLGRPRRAWQFTSLSNERDRPSLSLPLAQPFITTLQTFGWRESRQDPTSNRETDPTVLQPAILANGVLSRRFIRMSEDSAFTRLALESDSLDGYITAVYERVLSRRPTARELGLFRELLTDGFANRVIPDATPAPIFRERSTGVSWSNHLSTEANEAQVALQAEVEAGDPPTARLTEDWRLRAEDMLWALLNSPEFVFVP